MVRAIIANPAGFDLDFGGGLILIRTTDQLTIEVEWKNFGPFEGNMKEVEHKSFPVEKIEEAATFFVQKRHELRLGIDFETIDQARVK